MKISEIVAEARANTDSARAGLAKRKETKPLTPNEQIAKDKAKSDRWLEKERAKMAAKKGVAETTGSSSIGTAMTGGSSPNVGTLFGGSYKPKTPFTAKKKKAGKK